MTTPTSHLNKFNDYFGKLIYAAMDDIAEKWNGVVKNPCYWQNYKNLCKKKADQDPVNNALVLSVQVKHFLAFLFKRLIDEIKITPLENSDTPAIVCDKASAENDECYTKFMFQVAKKYKKLFGPTLAGATDETKWFQNQIVGGLPGFTAKPVVITVISFEFEVFLKAIAWHLAPYVWYQQVLVKITDVMFVATMAQQSMCQDMIDVMMSCVPEKAPAKPRTTKKKTDATADAKPSPTTPPEEAKPAEEPAQVIAPVENIGTDDEELAGLLEDV